MGAVISTRARGGNDLLEAIAAYELWSFLAWQDIRIKYRRSKIGPMWITISMAVFCIALGIVYSQLFKTEIRELLPFLAIGLVVWGFLSSCLGEMPNLFVDNAPYIRDMRINPLTIIFRALARNAIVFGHNLLIVLGIYLVFGMWPGWVTQHCRGAIQRSFPDHAKHSPGRLFHHSHFLVSALAGKRELDNCHQSSGLFH